MSQEVLIEGTSYAVDQLLLTQEGQETLAAARLNDSPICCLCCQAQPRLHTWQRHGQWYLSRLPMSGPQHHPSCDDYRDPDHAARERDKRCSASAILQKDGVVDACLNLPLVSLPNQPLEPAIRHALRVHEDNGRRRTTLFGLLSYMYQKSGLGNWSPYDMRSSAWSPAAGRLARISEEMQLAGVPLADRLILPRFTNQQKVAETLAKFWQQPDSLVHRYLLAIGEVRQIDTACTDSEAQIFLHYWREPFRVKQSVLDAAIRHKTYSNVRGALSEIDQPDPASRVLLIGRVEVPPDGKPRFLNVAFLVVSKSLIPVQSAYELEFVNRAVAEGRWFHKPMAVVEGFPYILDALLTDTATPCPCEILGVRNNPDYDAHVEQKISEYPRYFAHPAWIWDARNGSRMPRLPPPRGK